MANTRPHHTRSPLYRNLRGPHDAAPAVVLEDHVLAPGPPAPVLLVGVGVVDDGRAAHVGRPGKGAVVHLELPAAVVHPVPLPPLRRVGRRPGPARPPVLVQLAVVPVARRDLEGVPDERLQRGGARGDDAEVELQAGRGRDVSLVVCDSVSGNGRSGT